MIVTRSIGENILNVSKNTKAFELQPNLQNHEVCSHHGTKIPYSHQYTSSQRLDRW